MNLDDLLHKPSPTRNWSPFQENIYAASPPLLIEAVAGSGKTTTLIEKMNRMAGNSIFLAFNKSIASEISSRVNFGVTVKTLNALGHQILMRNRPGAKLDAWRISKRFRQILNPEDNQLYGMQLCRAISSVKAEANFDPQFEDFINVMNSYELEIPSDLQPQFARICQRVFSEMSKNLDTFDFDDQLYLPIKHGWTFPLFDHVFVDEAQDLSAIQHLMLQRLVDRGASLTGVGDRCQAIYGFRGASSNSMDEMKRQFSMSELPLSISYRCSQAVIREAQLLVPHIQARDGAPEGSVTQAEDYPEIESYLPDDIIVCRNNAPIFQLALDFIRNNRQCRVMSNFLETIETFINQFDCSSTKDLRIKLEAWYKKEYAAAESAGRYGKLGVIQDKYDVLCTLCNSLPTVYDILTTIRSLATSQFGPRISTVHRAKGLEAPRTFILRPDLLPSPRAETEAQRKAENNLKYVAITRAKLDLIYLPREEA